MTISVILQAAGSALLLSLTQPSGDAVPDFSHVGYHHGDDPIPQYEVITTLTAPEDSTTDASVMIQEAIDNARSKGAILLKEGTYFIYKPIRLNRSNLVLRGEGEGTVLVDMSCRDTVNYKKWRDYMKYSMIHLGLDTERDVDRDGKILIAERYVPVGRMFLKLEDSTPLEPGDRIVIFRPGSDQWIHDIKMDQIPMTSKTSKVKQWTAKGYNMYWEREIVSIKGNKIFLDNPVVMGLDYRYSECHVMKCSTRRISESGVENLKMVSRYNPARHDKNKGYRNDELHGWTAISVHGAENCWVSGTVSYHFCQSSINVGKLSRCITVQNCRSYDPVSVITGQRRYAFHISHGECCIVRDCYCDEDRHGYPASAKTPGPNVYLRCSMTNAHSDCGPHQRWATGFLYDNVSTDGFLGVTDGHSWGSGHGWRGANFVLWNCESATLGVQNPWKSAQNWCVGCIGTINNVIKNGVTFENTQRSYDDGLQRPKAVFSSYGQHVEPASLYEWQLEQRRPQ